MNIIERIFSHKITILERRLPVLKEQVYGRTDYVTMLGNYKCWITSTHDGNEYKEHGGIAAFVTSQINEAQAMWAKTFVKFKGLTIEEAGEMAKYNGNGWPIKYLIEKYNLPEEARTWLNSEERIVSVWERGAAAYTATTKALRETLCTWSNIDEYFLCTYVNNHAIVIFNGELYMYTSNEQVLSLGTRAFKCDLEICAWREVGV